MADVATVLKDPNFSGLPVEERRKVLLKIDPNFGGLARPEQDKVLGFKATPEQPGAITRFAKSAYETTPIPAAVEQATALQEARKKGVVPYLKETAKLAVLDSPPVQAGQMIWDAAKNAYVEVGKAGGALVAGDIPGAVEHYVGAVPIVGPGLVKGTEQIRRGDVAGGLGTYTGIAGQAALMRRGGEETGALPKRPRSEPPPISPEEATTRDIARLNREVPGGLGMTRREMRGQEPGIMQKLASYTMSGRSAMRNIREQALGRIQNEVNNWLNKIAPSGTPKEKGEIIQSGIDTVARNAFDGEVKRQFGDVREAGKDVTVNISAAKQRAFEREQELTLPSDLGDQETPGKAPAMLLPPAEAGKILKAFQALPDEISFAQAAEWRSRLSQVRFPDELFVGRGQREAAISKREISEAMQGEARKEAPAKLLRTAPADVLDKLIDDRGQMLTGEPWRKYEQAKNFYRDGVALFNHEELTKMLKADPERFASMIGPKDVSRAEDLRDIFTKYKQFASPEEQAQLQDAQDTFREQWIRQHILAQPEAGPSSQWGVDKPIDFKKLGERVQGIDQSTLTAIFGDDPKSGKAVKNLITVSKALGRMQDLPAHGLARLREAYVLLTAPAALLGGGVVGALGAAGTAVAGFASAEVLGKLITKVIYSPWRTRLFVEGLDPKMAQAAGAARIAQAVSGNPPGEAPPRGPGQAPPPQGPPTPQRPMGPSGRIGAPPPAPDEPPQASTRPPLSQTTAGAPSRVPESLQRGLKRPGPDQPPQPTTRPRLSETAQGKPSVVPPTLRRDEARTQVAKGYAGTRSSQAQRRSSAAPPETGVPEQVARVQESRERLAQQEFNKPWSKVTNLEAQLIDEEIKSGRSGAPPVPPGTLRERARKSARGKRKTDAPPKPLE